MIELYQGDCFDLIDNIQDNLVNCVITSPPYNVDLGNNKYNTFGYNFYVDNKDHYDYIIWLKEIFCKLKNKLSDDGRVCINIGDGKNGAVPTSSDIIKLMVDLKYIPITHIIWNKMTTSARTAWGSFMSPSSPSYPTPFEHILIFSNKETKLLHDGKTDITKAEFIKYAYALWEFPPENNLQILGHPAPFPEELPKRCIKMNTYIGDTVLDPFMGSGTTGVACKNLRRNFIGIELDSNYFKIAEKRIGNTHSQYKLFD